MEKTLNFIKIWGPSILLIFVFIIVARYTGFFQSFESNVYAEMTGLFINLILVAAFIELIKYSEKSIDRYLNRHTIVTKGFNILNQIFDLLIDNLNIGEDIINEKYKNKKMYIDDRIKRDIDLKIELILDQVKKPDTCFINKSDFDNMFKDLNLIASNLDRFINIFPYADKLLILKEYIESFIMALEMDYTVMTFTPDEGGERIEKVLISSTGIRLFGLFCKSLSEDMSYYSKEYMLKLYFQRNKLFSDFYILNFYTSLFARRYWRKKK